MNMCRGLLLPFPVKQHDVWEKIKLCNRFKSAVAVIIFSVSPRKLLNTIHSCHELQPELWVSKSLFCSFFKSRRDMMIDELHPSNQLTLNWSFYCQYTIFLAQYNKIYNQWHLRWRFKHELHPVWCEGREEFTFFCTTWTLQL